MKLEFSRQIFEKYSKIKFHEDPPRGTRIIPCEWTDGHDEAKCRRAKKKNVSYPKRVVMKFTLVGKFFEQWNVQRSGPVCLTACTTNRSTNLMLCTWRI